MAVAVDPHTGCVLRIHHRIHSIPTAPPSQRDAPCENSDVAKLLPAFIRGGSELSPQQRVMARDHLGLCSSCRALAQSPQRSQEN